VTPEQSDKIYERMNALVLNMPTDPSSLGPEFLREQISLCRNYLNEVSHYFQDVLVQEARLATDLDAVEAVYGIRSSELLATDPSVAARPNITDRQAMIDVILKDEKQRIIRLESQIRSLSHVKAVIRYRKGELDNTMSAIRLQRSLLRDQLKTGSFYGDESEHSRGRSMDPADEIGAFDLEALITSSEEEIESERADRATLRAASKRAPQPPRPSVVMDPADGLDATTLEALIRGIVDVEKPTAIKAEKPTAIKAEKAETIKAEKPTAIKADKAETVDKVDATDETEDEAIIRFLEEPDDDIESLIANL
jgi:hypothetical protein